MHKTGAYMVTG